MSQLENQKRKTPRTTPPAPPASALQPPAAPAPPQAQGQAQAPAPAPPKPPTAAAAAGSRPSPDAKINVLPEVGKNAATVVIANITPRIDDGHSHVKRLAWEDLHVRADLFRDGHDILAAVLKWRPAGASEWAESPMQEFEVDRWESSCCFRDPGLHEYAVEAWSDLFCTWVHDFDKKFEAGQEDLGTEIQEGAILVNAAASRAGDAGHRVESGRLGFHAEVIGNAKAPRAVAEHLKAPELHALMERWADRSLSTTSDPLGVTVERERAGFSAWYEFFPRNALGHSDRTSTFRDCLPRLDDARAMGFDVIYFPPIHPIGVTARKGKNNAVTCKPGEPGSPWAIGSAEGGHRSVEPALGTLEDFQWLLDEAKARDLEIAIDFAINCSPDHPYVREHPEWFFHRPDGSIKYAENPPKKYQDIYPINFHCDDWRALWREMVDVVLFWVEKGVRIFRVDNPHTKPVGFWEYLIREVRAVAPDTIFLAEAFTRPKMMQTLGKIGFSQSYTYFTWRLAKHELMEYVNELTKTGMAEYFRGNFWPNTPDILAEPLRDAGPAAFKMRAALAAMLSPNWGMFSGYEFCEGQPASPSNEEYLNSDKYEFKKRDWDKPDNIKDFIGRLNHIRRTNPALQENTNIEFCHTGNDNILAWVKATADRENIILVAINLDPDHAQESDLQIPLEHLQLPGDAPLRVEDLLQDGAIYEWRGHHNFVALDPKDKVAHVFRISV